MGRLALKHCLLDRGLTLVSLANQIGVSYDRIIKITNGYRQPRVEEVRAIASVLSIGPEVLGLESEGCDV